MTAGPAIVAVLLLAGCAGNGGWAKPGGDAASAGTDYDECAALGHQAVGPDTAIDQDIVASRGSDIARAAGVRTGARLMQESTRDRGDAIAASCMAAKGYTKPK